MSGMLPEPFADLEPLAPRWVLATERERREERMARSTMEDLEALYHAVQPRVDAALEHLNGFDIDALPEREHNLLLLLFSYVEASVAVELFHQPVPPNAYEWHRFECTF